jgi:hypothetical protein
MQFITMPTPESHLSIFIFRIVVLRVDFRDRRAVVFQELLSLPILPSCSVARFDDSDFAVHITGSLVSVVALRWYQNEPLQPHYLGIAAFDLSAKDSLEHVEMKVGKCEPPKGTSVRNA